MASGLIRGDGDSAGLFRRLFCRSMRRIRSKPGWSDRARRMRVLLAVLVSL